MVSKTPLEKRENGGSKPSKQVTSPQHAPKLKFKRSHSCQDGSSFFPIHKWMFCLLCLLDAYLVVFGALLLLCGMYANTGYFSLLAITNKVYPNINLIDENRTFSRLDFLTLSCWISGNLIQVIQDLKHIEQLFNS